MPDAHADQVYFDYLRGRSRLGLWYRRYYLYPRLSRMLTGRVLDFGCGIGDFLNFRPDTVGVDINAETVEFCRAAGRDARLIENGRIPWADASFDGVIMDNVLEHIPEERADAVVDEVLRVLVDSGTVLIGVPGQKGYASDSDHKRFYRESDLQQLMSRHGCVATRTIHTPLKGSFADRRLSQYCIYAAFSTAGNGVSA